jgi:cytochrome c-type biogenesis protein CcmH/NrfG
VAFSPDGQTLAAACRDSAVRLWGLGEGTPRERDVLRVPWGEVQSVVFSPDGQLLASTAGGLDDNGKNRGGEVTLWDLATREPRSTFSGGSAEGFGPVAFSADGQMLAAADQGGRILVWHVSGETLYDRKLPGPVLGVAFAPDGRHLATVNSDTTVYVLRLYDELDQALADYEEALRRGPPSVEALLGRGQVSLRQFERGQRGPAPERLGQALRDVTEAIRLDPECEGAYLLRALVHAHRKDYKRAIADYTRVIHMDPGNAPAYYNRGLLYAEEEDYARAKADLDRALTLDPELGKK